MDTQKTINIKVVVLIFCAGMAWGSLMLGIRDIHSQMATINGRVSHIEQYLVPATKGMFIPDADAPAVKP